MEKLSKKKQTEFILWKENLEHGVFDLINEKDYEEFMNIYEQLTIENKKDIDIYENNTIQKYNIQDDEEIFFSSKTIISVVLICYFFYILFDDFVTIIINFSDI